MKLAPRTILLAEDDLFTRQVTSRLLQEQGYTVLQASDGRHALSIICWHQDPIDLLFTDVMMPELNGRQLVDIARALRPGLKTLYTSSCLDAMIVERGVIQAGMPFIPKSAGVEELCQKVRQVLDETTSSDGLAA